MMFRRIHGITTPSPSAPPARLPPARADGTTFSPEASLTRGQFIVMLMRAYNIEVDETLTDNFDDAGDTYYTAYLATAKSLGITSGVGENMFAPEDEITRQDMFTLLYRSLDILGELPENGRYLFLIRLQRRG